uniref:Aminotransferase-like plant mobile domain-containing protein n=1 Tax=Fagus sylvatica TaxID=28930 RepID=A0A2N9IPV6_FAGSY
MESPTFLSGQTDDHLPPPSRLSLTPHASASLTPLPHASHLRLPQASRLPHASPSRLTPHASASLTPLPHASPSRLTPPPPSRLSLTPHTSASLTPPPPSASPHLTSRLPQPQLTPHPRGFPTSNTILSRPSLPLSISFESVLSLSVGDNNLTAVLDLLDMEPGPIDDSVLTRQATHRSNNIWKIDDSTPLTCRRREATLARSGLNNPRIVSYLRRAGFYGLSRLPFIKLDWHFITALVERWRPETHTFHLPSGEMTITLEDVSIQLGLPVDGLPVTGLIDSKWRELCIRLLGVDPPSPQLSGSRLSLNWLAQQFPPLAADADDVTVERYARMYILQLMGGSIFADKSQDKVHLMFLTLLEDFDVAGKYSWGGATLAWLYREMCKAAKIGASEIGGALILLQLWARDRFPHIAPQRLLREHIEPFVDIEGQPLPRGPLGIRWRDDLNAQGVATHAVTSYRYMLDRQKPSQVVWQPYSDEVIADLPEYCTVGKEIWRAVVPLICFHIVEKHYPDRVMRQFGMQQHIPSNVNTDEKLHSIDLRGQGQKNWEHSHAPHIELWQNRREHIASADPQVGLMDENDEYMKWYRRITRRFISPMGALIDAMTSSLARIRELAEPESEIFTIACAALALDSSTSTTTTPQPIATPSTSTTPTPEPFVTQSTTTNVAPSTSTTTTSQPIVAPSISTTPTPELFITPSTTTTSIPQPYIAPSTSTTPTPEPFVTLSSTTTSIPQPYVAPATSTTTTPQPVVAPSTSTTPIPESFVTPSIISTSIPQPYVAPAISTITTHQPVVVPSISTTPIPEPYFVPFTSITPIPEPYFAQSTSTTPTPIPEPFVTPSTTTSQPYVAPSTTTTPILEPFIAPSTTTAPTIVVLNPQTLQHSNIPAMSSLQHPQSGQVDEHITQIESIGQIQVPLITYGRGKRRKRCARDPSLIKGVQEPEERKYPLRKRKPKRGCGTG